MKDTPEIADYDKLEAVARALRQLLLDLGGRLS